MTQKSPPNKKNWSWRSQAFRGLIYQIIAIGLVALGAWWLASNTLHNMQVRGIQSGFDFLKGPAGFDIGESLYPRNRAIGPRHGPRPTRRVLRYRFRLNPASPTGKHFSLASPTRFALRSLALF